MWQARWAWATDRSDYGTGAFNLAETPALNLIPNPVTSTCVLEVTPLRFRSGGGPPKSAILWLPMGEVGEPAQVQAESPRARVRDHQQAQHHLCSEQHPERVAVPGQGVRAGLILL